MSDALRTIEITAADLELMLAEAATRGAAQALRSLGLHDETASDDLREIRSLLKSWREIRRSALQSVVKLLTTALLGAVLLGLGIKLGALKAIAGAE